MTPTVIRYAPTPNGFIAVVTAGSGKRFRAIVQRYSIYPAKGTTCLESEKVYRTEDHAIDCFEEYMKGEQRKGYCPMRTIYWTGYSEGAIPADSDLIAGTIRTKDGNLYVTTTDGGIYNVHPKVTEAGEGGNYVSYKRGVYPVRWKLDDFEKKEFKLALYDEMM